jgi:hypothetical protein
MLSSCAKDNKDAKNEPNVMDIPALSEQVKKEVIVKKYFEDDNTFIIECKGFPKDGLEGKARIESAKEAALINAQICSRDLFNESVDVIRNGEIHKYDIEDDYVVIHYAVIKNRLRKSYKE